MLQAARPGDSFAGIDGEALLGEGSGAEEAFLGAQHSPDVSLMTFDSPAESPLSVVVEGGQQRGPIM